MHEIDSFVDGYTLRDLKVMEKLLAIRNRRIDFAMHHHRNTRGEKMNFVENPFLPQIYNSLARVIAIQGSVQSKKAQPLTSKVHTPDGWKLMGDLKIGDLVSTPDGGVAPILGIQPQGTIGIYKIVLSDGRVVEACGEHLWNVRWSNCRFKPCRGLVYESPAPTEILTTSEIGRRMASGGGRFSLPLTKPVEKPEAKLALDPYFIGLMLGDGEIGNRNIRFCSVDEELVAAANEGVRGLGLDLKRDGDSPGYFFRSDTGRGHEGAGSRILKNKFAELGLLGTDSYSKFIPEVIKNGSIAQRLAVLQGLMDTDGHAKGILSTASKQLARDIQEVVFSLGGMAKITVKPSAYILADGSRHRGATAFWMQISHPAPASLFRLARKKDAAAKEHRRIDTLGPVIEKIKFTGMKEAQCIVVGHPDHLYVTDGYVVTHNSEFMIIDHLAQSAEGLSVFFVLPKVEARVTYVQNRVDKRIRESPEYRKLAAAGDFDNALIKGFGRGTIKYVGSNVVSDFKEFPGDSLFVEEVDECHETNIEYGRDRLRGSIYQFRRYVGNPRLKGRGINKYYRKTNQNRWHIPCRKCGQPIELDWFKTVIHQKFDIEGNAVDWQLLDQDWKPGCGRDVHCMCPKCNVPIDRLGKNGLWVPADPEATMEGYHMTMLNSWENNISEMVETWQQAWDDVEIMQLFYNSYLGVPYSADQARLTDQMLQKCAYIHEPYAFVIKNNNAHVADDCCKSKCSMGIDVGKKFDVRISEVLKDGRRRAVFIGKVDTREELINLGRRYNVYVAVIDSMPEYRVVMDLQADAPFHVWACRYESEGKDRRAKRDRKNRLISGDRTVLMDRALSEIKSGRNILPTNYKSIMKGKYVDEMLEPVRQEEKDSAGNVKFVWSKGEDHQRHCDVYDMLAADLCEVGALSGIAVG